MSEYLLSVEEQSTAIIDGTCEGLRTMRKAIGWSRNAVAKMIGMWGNSVLRVEQIGGGGRMATSPVGSPASDSIVRALVVYGRAMESAAEALGLECSDVARMANITEGEVRLVFRGECLNRDALMRVAHVMGQRIKIGRMREAAEGLNR